MTSLDWKPLCESDERHIVLAAYRADQAVRKRADAEHAGWVARLTAIAGVEESHLSRIHGKLIAYGLLKFQLTGRTTGVQYQVSPAGNEALDRAASGPSTTPASDQHAA